MCTRCLNTESDRNGYINPDTGRGILQKESTMKHADTKVGERQSTNVNPNTYDKGIHRKN